MMSFGALNTFFHGTADFEHPVALRARMQAIAKPEEIDEYGRMKSKSQKKTKTTKANSRKPFGNRRQSRWPSPPRSRKGPGRGVAKNRWLDL
jgi:hypothetical protein